MESHVYYLDCPSNLSKLFMSINKLTESKILPFREGFEKSLKEDLVQALSKYDLFDKIVINLNIPEEAEKVDITLYLNYTRKIKA